MQLKRIIALLCAAIYISTIGAAASQTEPSAVQTEAVPSAETVLSESVSSELPEQAQAAELADQTEKQLAEVVSDTQNLALSTPMARAVTVKPTTHNIQVNGKTVYPQAYCISGSNYFKLRDIAYLLNGTSASFNVTWDNDNRAVNMLPGQNYAAVGGEMTVASSTSLRVSESTAKVLLNGKSISMSGYSINGNNYYKIRDIAEVIGFSVDYENISRTVVIEASSVSTPSDDPEDTAFVTGIYQVKVDSWLSIRSGPGTTYSVVGKLNNGDKIVVDSLSNGWAHIMNTSSYCSADYLVRVSDYDADSTPEEPDAPDDTDNTEQPDEEFVTGVYRVKVDSSLSVRNGPGTQYSIVGRLQNGDEIVVDDLTDGWAHIMDTSTASGRYCSADYLTRVRDYDVSEGEPDDVVDPPRTSNIDGKMTVIIDAGHGGSDIGAQNADGTLNEKHINLTVAQYLQSYLEQAGVKVIMVRDTLEEGSSLSLRGTVMQQYADSADLFFSIHHNAANTTARGAEVLAQIADKNGGPSKILGEALLEEYSKLGVSIRGIVFKEGSNGDYYYTNRIAASLFIPAITSEFCFIDNTEDQQFIDSEQDLQAQARAQYNAIMYYFTQVDY